MKVLVVGDIVGKPGRLAAERFIAPMRQELGIDAVVVNCENAAGGAGITIETAEALFRAGADVLTSGNHVWKKSEVLELFKMDHRLLRPANYADGAAGSGTVVIETMSRQKVAVMNLQGRVFMPDLVDDPFRVGLREVERLRQITPNIIIDMHAEATSEKVALGWYLDGKVSCIFGTHTHIQTADERILPRGTAYITDVGMTGPYDSVIGRQVDQILNKFLTGVPQKSDVADGNVQLRGALIDIDPKTGKATKIERVAKFLEKNA